MWGTFRTLYNNRRGSFVRIVSQTALCILVVSVGFPSRGVAQFETEARADIEALLNARMSLASCDVRITGQRSHRGASSAESIRILFDEGGAKTRYEYIGSGRELLYARNLKESLLYVQRSYVLIRDVPDKEYEIPDSMPFDIRTIGLATYYGISHCSPLAKIAEVFRSKPVLSYSIEPVGEHRIEWELNATGDQVVRRIAYLDERRSLEPRRIEMFIDRVRPGQTVEQNLALESDLETEEIDGLWLPTHWTIKDHQAEMGLDWSLSWTSVNQPIDATSFEVEGIQLANGVVIENRRTGTPIVERRIGNELPAPVAGGAGPNWRTAIVVANLFILLVFVSLGAYGRYRGRAK